MQITLSSVQCFGSSFNIEISHFSNFSHLGEFFLKLEEVEVSMFDASVLVSVLAVLLGSHFVESLVILLVSAFLVMLLRKLKLESVDVFAKGKKQIRLLLNVFLSSENIAVPAGNLLTDATDLSLALGSGPALVSDHMSMVV